jgi:chloramphenicol-sensitive protein RarD
MAGPLTLVPLTCFNTAARHLPYATLGFLQYLAPTLVLLLAVFLYDEPLAPANLLAFACIWAALLVYSLDIWRTLRRS